MNTIIVSFAQEDRPAFIGHSDRAFRPRSTLILGRADHTVQLYTVRSVEPVDDGSIHVLVGHPFPAPQTVTARYLTECRAAETIATSNDPDRDLSLLNHLDDATLLRAYQRTDGKPGNLDADMLLVEIERRNLDV